MVDLQLTNNCGRKIEGLYVRKKGESDWGSNWLAVAGGYVPVGGVYSLRFAPPGDYEMRALCCGGQVVSENSATLTSATYDWTVIAALDIHNDTPSQIEELYYQPSGQAGWGSNVLEMDAPWPGCGSHPGPIPAYGVLRCYLAPGSYDLHVSAPGFGRTEINRDVEGNSAWFLESSRFWTPPED
jgi:hypothetical protein